MSGRGNALLSEKVNSLLRFLHHGAFLVKDGDGAAIVLHRLGQPLDEPTRRSEVIADFEAHLDPLVVIKMQAPSARCIGPAIDLR